MIGTAGSPAPGEPLDPVSRIATNRHPGSAESTTWRAITFRRGWIPLSPPLEWRSFPPHCCSEEASSAWHGQEPAEITAGGYEPQAAGFAELWERISRLSQLQTMNFDELVEEFDFLGNWEDQCDLLIDLGFELPKFPEEFRTEENRVHGCQSNVWLVGRPTADEPPVLEIRADSDAMIVRGLIAALLSLYAGRTPQEILDVDVRACFSRLGLDQHLSSARRNGLNGMVQRVRALARECLESHPERSGEC